MLEHAKVCSNNTNKAKFQLLFRIIQQALVINQKYHNHWLKRVFHTLLNKMIRLNAALVVISMVQSGMLNLAMYPTANTLKILNLYWSIH